MKKLYSLFIALFIFSFLNAQDTLIVQTFTLDSTSRAGVFEFPDDPGTTYEKIIMQYRMRCHDALVGNGNVGCWEWDYHCNTVVTDSSSIDSLWSTHPTHVVVGSNANPYYYVFDPTFKYYLYTQQEVVYNQILSEDSAAIGAGTLQLDMPFDTEFSLGKTQVLLSEEELTTAGLNSGNITGLRLNLDETGSEIEFLKIKFKHTEKTELDYTMPDVEDFTEVYFLNSSFSSPGKYSFNFYEPFTWDGSSNILIEFSFTNEDIGNTNVVLGHSTNNISAITTKAEDRFLAVNMGDHIEVPADAFAPLDSFITVSFWQYGDPDLQPFNSYIFEGADANNNRVINSHLPWSNSRVYWDAGNSGTGSYDRIDQLANFSDFAGQWNHWAFTKNSVSGEMKIYLNGSLWHSGSGMTRSMDGIVKFKIAGSSNEGRYAGFINDFRVWDVDLDESTIQEWMYRDVDNSHPNYNDLLVYYKLDEEDGDVVFDHSSNGYDGTISGQPLRISKKGHQLTRNFTPETLRPNIELVQGEYNQTITETNYLDSLQKPFNIVYDYYVANNDLYVNDTNYYWESGYMGIFNENNELVDSIYIAAEDSIIIETLEYYQKWTSRYELVSFITPYGNGLDLGEEGVMWEFDVTDFTPVLKGEKYLSIEGVGRWSEEYDIRFLFIEGTPARDVLSIQSIWPIASASSIWYSTGYNQIWDDTRFEPRNVLMNPDASYFKIRSAITGHGQSGEFVGKYHYMNIDGGDNEFEYKVWNECSTIPVYPQGGTWIYDRAGWCPGDPTTLWDFDITEFVTPGQTHTIDYGLTSTAGLSQADYRISNQLVTYGAANHNLDAAVLGVGNPNNADASYLRFNPSCMFPTVTIRNDGLTPITSLDIEYFVDDGDVKDYSWNGTLEFLDSVEIELPVPIFTFWFGSSNHFNVHITNTNGQQDEYPNNDYYRIEFDDPDAFENDITFSLECMTNNRGWQTYYTLEDASGNILIERDDLEDNTLYVDEFNLMPGCYKIRIEDSADDGLYWWHSSTQGTGSFKLKDSDGYNLEVFEPEFGRFAEYEFVVYNETLVEEVEKSYIFSIYPNPATSEITLEFTSMKNEKVEITLLNSSMNILSNEFIHICSDNQTHQQS